LLEMQMNRCYEYKGIPAISCGKSKIIIFKVFMQLF